MDEKLCCEVGKQEAICLLSWVQGSSLLFETCHTVRPEGLNLILGPGAASPLQVDKDEQGPIAQSAAKRGRCAYFASFSTWKWSGGAQRWLRESQLGEGVRGVTTAPSQAQALQNPNIPAEEA